MYRVFKCLTKYNTLYISMDFARQLKKCLKQISTSHTLSSCVLYVISIIFKKLVACLAWKRRWICRCANFISSLWTFFHDNCFLGSSSTSRCRVPGGRIAKCRFQRRITIQPKLHDGHWRVRRRREKRNDIGEFRRPWLTVTDHMFEAIRQQRVMLKTCYSPLYFPK